MCGGKCYAFLRANIFFKRLLREKYDPINTRFQRYLKIFLEQKPEKFKRFPKVI